MPITKNMITIVIILVIVLSAVAYYVFGIKQSGNEINKQTSDVVLYMNKTETFTGGLEMTLTAITAEEIAPNLNNVQNYPSGSGIVAEILAKIGDKSEKIFFSKLSPPYESRLVSKWQGYEISAIEMPENANKDSQVKLRVIYSGN